MRYDGYKLIKRVRQLGVFQSSAKTARPEEKIMLFHEVGFCETTASSHPSHRIQTVRNDGFFFIYQAFILVRMFKSQNQNFLNILTSLVIYIGKYLYRTNYDKNQNTLHNPVCSYWPKFPFPCRINLQRKAYLSCHF